MQKSTLHPAFVPVGEVIERAIHLVRILPEFQRIQIRYSHDGEKLAWIDSGKVERIVMNLLFKACEAVSPETGEIEVRSSVETGKIEICVTDNGAGIPESIRESLFQPFVSHGKEQGTGLGLTVVQKLAQNHGGDVRVESTGPAGSTFRVLILSPSPAESAPGRS